MTADDKKILRKYIKTEGDKALATLCRRETKAIAAVNIASTLKTVLDRELATVRSAVTEARAVMDKLKDAGARVIVSTALSYTQALVIPDPNTLELGLTQAQKEYEERSVRKTFNAHRRKIEDTIQSAQFEIVSEGLPDIKTQMMNLREALAIISGPEE